MSRFLNFNLKLIVFLFFLSGAAIHAQQNNGVDTDKAAHFGVAAAAQTGCSAVGKAVTKSKVGSGLACFLVINTAGLVKEATDPYRGGSRDRNDVYANLAGSGFSFLAVTFAF